MKSIKTRLLRLSLSRKLKPVIVFDFDGVIVESNKIKTLAFKKLFSDYSEKEQEEIALYHKRNEGISRVNKIKYFFSKIIKKELTPDKLVYYERRFSDLVKDSVVNSCFVKGCIDFLEKYAFDFDFYIASGTPEYELREIVQRKKIDCYFKGVFGSPELKEFIIKKIINSQNLMSSQVWMVGDSMTDYRAAVNTGVNFIGRVHEEDIFPAGTQSENDPYPIIESLLNEYLSSF